MKGVDTRNRPLSVHALTKRLSRGVHGLMRREVKSFERPESATEFGRGAGVFANALPTLRRWTTGLTNLSDLSLRIAGGRFRRVVTKALALKPRGFVPRDVLVLTKLSGQLQVEWRARDIHPWDRDQPAGRRAEFFREQALHDTTDAVVRLFQILPEIDVLGIRVLHPSTPGVQLMLAGTVSRSEAFAARALSSPGISWSWGFGIGSETAISSRWSDVGAATRGVTPLHCKMQDRFQPDALRGRPRHEVRFLPDSLAPHALDESRHSASSWEV